MFSNPFINLLYQDNHQIIELFKQIESQLKKHIPQDKLLDSDFNHLGFSELRNQNKEIDSFLFLAQNILETIALEAHENSQKAQDSLSGEINNSFHDDK